MSGAQAPDPQMKQSIDGLLAYAEAFCEIALEIIVKDPNSSVDSPEHMAATAAARALSRVVDPNMLKSVKGQIMQALQGAQSGAPGGAPMGAPQQQQVPQQQAPQGQRNLQEAM
jgi:hypothetical protein